MKNKLKNNPKKLFTNVCSFCIIITQNKQGFERIIQKEGNKMYDYECQYIVEGEKAIDYVTLEDWYGDFTEDFIIDELVKMKETQDIKLLWYRPVVDREVNVENLRG